MTDLILSAYNFYDRGFNSASSLHGLIEPGGGFVYPDRGAKDLGPGREGFGFRTPYAVPLCRTENYLVCTRGYNDYLLQAGGAIYFAPLRNSYTAHSSDPVPASTFGVWGGVQLPQSQGPITEDFIDDAVPSDYWPVGMWLDGDRALVLLRTEGTFMLALIEPGQAPKVAVTASTPSGATLPSGIGIDAAGNVRVAVTNGWVATFEGIYILATQVWVSDPIALSSLSAGSPPTLTFGASSGLFDSWRATGTVVAIARSFGGEFIKAIASGPSIRSGEGSPQGSAVMQVLGTPVSGDLVRVHMVRPLSAPGNERPPMEGPETGWEYPVLEVVFADVATAGNGYIVRPGNDDFSPVIWTPSTDMQGLWPLNPGVTWVGIDTPTTGAVTPPFWTQFKRSIEIA
jgi:hypothetical protein